MLNCANCGTANLPEMGYCEKCGQPLASLAYPVAPAPPVVSQKAGTNPLAVASLLLGLVSLFPLFGILAVIFGHVARAQVRKSAGWQKGAGMALAGLILGYLWLAFILFLLLVVLPSLRF